MKPFVAALLLSSTTACSFIALDRPHDPRLRGVPETCTESNVAPIVDVFTATFFTLCAAASAALISHPFWNSDGSMTDFAEGGAVAASAFAVSSIYGLATTDRCRSARSQEDGRSRVAELGTAGHTCRMSPNPADAGTCDDGLACLDGICYVPCQVLAHSVENGDVWTCDAAAGTCDGRRVCVPH